jgi:hypothetical protein
MPPPGVPDWVYPGMLLVSRDGGPERYVIEIVEVNAGGGYRVVVQTLRRMSNNEFGIDRTPNNWPIGGQWLDLGLFLQRFEPLGYHNPISPFPRFRQLPREDLFDLTGTKDKPEAPRLTVYDRILEDDDD